jgi:hypothetical protein
MTSSSKQFGMAVPSASWVASSPNGVIRGRLGQLAILTTNGSVYQNTDGGTTWVLFQSAAPSGAVSMTSIGSLTANTIFSDWRPAGLASNRIITLRASDDTGSIVTGIDAVTDAIQVGDVRTFCNWGGLEDAGVVCFTNLDTRSAPANRIMTPGADTWHAAEMRADFYVGPGESVDLMYAAPLHDDPTFRAWVIMGGKRRHSALITQSLQLYPPITCVAITGTVHNYAPADDSPYVSSPGAVPSSEGGSNGRFASSSVIVLQTVDASGATITGLEYSDSETEGLGPVKYLFNAGPGDIVLANQNGGSAALNQFSFGGDVTQITLKPGRFALALWHRRDTGYWVQIGHSDSKFDADTLDSHVGARVEGVDVDQPLGAAWHTTLLANNDLAGVAKDAAIGHVAMAVGRNEGTYDTTNGALFCYGVLGIGKASRSAGANAVTNAGGYFTASLGQVNWALFTDAGNNVFNAGSGESSFIGTLNALGAFISTKAHVFTGIISPAVLAAGDTPDYAPTDFATARIVRMTSNAAGTSTLSGLAGGSNGRVITLVNVGAYAINTLASSGLSAAANRFAEAFAVPIGGSVTIWYDGTSALWRRM